MIIAHHEDFHGESLETVLGSGLRLDLPLCLRIAHGVTRVLQGLHAARRLHGDILRPIS